MTLLSPSIRAIPFDEVPPNGLTIELLTEQQRSRLAEIATVISLPHNAVLYGEDSPVDAVFLTARGVLKAYRDLPSGRPCPGRPLRQLGRGGHASGPVPHPARRSEGVVP
jgi:hypothetical protein